MVVIEGPPVANANVRYACLPYLLVQMILPRHNDEYLR